MPLPGHIQPFGGPSVGNPVGRTLLGGDTQGGGSLVVPPIKGIVNYTISVPSKSNTAAGGGRKDIHIRRRRQFAS